MAPGLPRTSFNSSRLVRVLADLDIPGGADGKQSFAERLAQWLDFTDAISLSAALKPVAARGGDGPAGEPCSKMAAVQAEVARVQAALIQSIGSNEALRGDGVADFSPFHRAYLAQQRSMDGSIGPLRAKVRSALSGLSPALGQLAALDAVMEETLRARERNLFMGLPLLLERRFEQLRRGHLALLAEARVEDRPELWTQPGGWLARFRGDMQNVLLAELDLRLQPVLGLIEATGNKVTEHQ